MTTEYKPAEGQSCNVLEGKLEGILQAIEVLDEKVDRVIDNQEGFSGAKDYDSSWMQGAYSDDNGNE